MGKHRRMGTHRRTGKGNASAQHRARARIGEWASIGEARASIGGNSTDAIDLGWADGYRKCICQVKGVAYIGAGCRWFTLDDAMAHWSNKPDREITMCLMMAALHIVYLRGWKTGENK
jgi:hypothetical protein